MLMIIFFSSNPSTMYLFFLRTLTSSILTSPLHLSWKMTARFLSSTLKYLAQTVNSPPLFIVSLLSLVFSLTSTVLCLSLTNAPSFLVYFTEFLIFVPTMKTFTPNLRLFGNYLTWTVSLPSCLINLFVVFLAISSSPNPLFTLVRRKWSISAFLSLAHILFKLEPKSPDFVTLLIPILIFDLSFTLPHASLLCFRWKIKFPNFWNLVLYTYLSVNAVPHRMRVKPNAIYTPECQNTWASLL